MSLSDREQRYLASIRDSIERIERYLPRTFEQFLRNQAVQDAVIWRLQTLADAARNHLSRQVKERHPEIRWRAIYGFRNIAAHGYADVTLALVWEIAKEHLTPLKQAVEAELP